MVNHSEERSIRLTLLALVGLLSVWIMIELVSQGLRLTRAQDPMAGLLEGECAYQLVLSGKPVGTRCFVDKMNMRDVLNSFGHNIPPGETADKLLPCDTVIHVDKSNQDIAFSRIPGGQLIALGKKVSLNSSSKEDLEAVPGIGPKMAERIVDYRSKIGSFSSLNELKNVSGIGNKKLDKLKEFLKM
ncbi:MAG: ComEA family DNA-binding protein [Desulfomonilaceae bacterium]